MRQRSRQDRRIAWRTHRRSQYAANSESQKLCRGFVRESIDRFGMRTQIESQPMTSRHVLGKASPNRGRGGGGVHQADGRKVFEVSRLELRLVDGFALVSSPGFDCPYESLLIYIRRGDDQDGKRLGDFDGQPTN